MGLLLGLVIDFSTEQQNLVSVAGYMEVDVTRHFNICMFSVAKLSRHRQLGTQRHKIQPKNNKSVAILFLSINLFVFFAHLIL